MVPYLSFHDISHSITALFELHIQSKQAQKEKKSCKLTSTPGRGCRAPWSAHRPTWWGSVRSWWSRSRSVSASWTWRSWIPTTAVRWRTSSVRRISPAPWRCPPKNKIELLEVSQFQNDFFVSSIFQKKKKMQKFDEFLP